MKSAKCARECTGRFANREPGTEPREPETTQKPAVGKPNREGRSVGKVGKGEESIGGGTGASFKELTGRKGARKGRGGVGGREGKEEGEAGACGERSSVVCLKNEVKAGAPHSTL